MKRSPLRFLGLTLLIGSAACAPYTTVGVTASESVVSGCEKVGEVAANPATAPRDVDNALSDAARAKGANYVLVASDGARTGTAYRCSMPTAASR